MYTILHNVKPNVILHKFAHVLHNFIQICTKLCKIWTFLSV